MLEEHDILILYLNTCALFKTHELELVEFENAKTIGDLYKIIRSIFI